MVNGNSPPAIPAIINSLIAGFIVFWLAATFNADARPPEKSWDNLCEECHGEHAEFSLKYMWVVDGRLEGQHHKTNLPLFLQNHYIPDHEIEAMSNMLASNANSPLRFDNECGSCHGELAVFMEKSIWVRGESMTAMSVGMEVDEFLKTHQELGEKDVEFYMKLFTRMSE